MENEVDVVEALRHNLITLNTALDLISQIKNLHLYRNSDEDGGRGSADLMMEESLQTLEVATYAYMKLTQEDYEQQKEEHDNG